MSVDPAAASAANNAAAFDAVITAELNALAADAQALQQQLSIGDVVAATVLPPNGLTDLVSILGSRVAAELPPNLTPGDTINVQVTGFSDDQIQLQVVSAPTPATTNANGAAASVATAAAATSLAETETPVSALLAETTGGVGVAATPYDESSVRPNAPVPPPLVPGAPLPDVLAAQRAPIPGAAGATPPPQVVAGGIEARLAAARTAAVQIPVPEPNASPGSGQPYPSASSGQPVLRNVTPGALPAAAAAQGARTLSPLPPIAPPPATGRPVPLPPQLGSLPSSTPGRAIPVPPLVVPRAATLALPANGVPAPAARAAIYASDPVALVRALNLPNTPTNVAAARLALDNPQRLPTALATLESALPAVDDPRVGTLRTLTAFFGKITPDSPQLATQIASYVEHVVGGSEPQLAQMLEALQQNSADTATANAADAQAAGAQAGATDDATAANAAAAPVAASAEPTLPVTALAQAIARAETLATSLKEQLFSLIAAPPATGREAELLVPAAASALTAVTSIQLAAAQAGAATPQTIGFAIPMWLGSGYAQARLSVDRDAPDQPTVPLDGDNFHIAFILDTKHLGTVAIDLRTVGRAFSLSVKTENLRSAQRFGDELSRLTDRLTTLRYQPKSVEAVVAGEGATSPSAVPEVAVVTDAPVAVEESTGFNARA